MSTWKPPWNWKRELRRAAWRRRILSKVTMRSSRSDRCASIAVDQQRRSIQTRKADLTTKDTKSTKFMTKNIWTLRGLRDLRGENVCAAFDEEQRSGNLRK